MSVCVCVCVCVCVYENHSINEMIYLKSKSIFFSEFFYEYAFCILWNWLTTKTILISFFSLCLF